MRARDRRASQTASAKGVVSIDVVALALVTITAIAIVSILAMLLADGMAMDQRPASKPRGSADISGDHPLTPT